MSDSDGEFERFLQEDEDSESPDPTPRKKPAAYSASSASAVTAAAAALLATSKIGKKHKSKKQSRKTSKKAAKEELSDSEDPPSYYAPSSVGASLDGDPYAFDMSAPTFPLPTKEEHVETRKQVKESKPIVQKAPAKSMEDRIAEILRRTGSTQLQASEDDHSGEEADKMSESDITKASENDNIASERFSGEDQIDNKQKDREDTASDAEGSSLSDSLGIESADFEVHLPPKPSAERPRISLSSLDSEGFVVNREAFDNGLATPSRYEQQQTMFLKSEQGDDSATEKDGYEDEGFELDQSASEIDAPPPYSPTEDHTQHMTTEVTQEPFVSQFDAMKALLLADPVSSITSNVDENNKINPPSPREDARSFSIAETPHSLEASDTFGYGDDDFEDIEASKSVQESPSSRRNDEVSAKLESEPHKSMVDSEYSGHYDNDDFEEDAVMPPTENNAGADISPTQRVDIDAADDRTARVNALLAEQYGDFYITEDTDDLSRNIAALTNLKQNVQDQIPALEVVNLQSDTEVTSASTDRKGTYGREESPPSSPPPPPPPADEDDEENQDLNNFSLNGANGVSASVPHRLAGQQLISDEEAKQQAFSSDVDRFRQLEGHVASLRFIEPVKTSTSIPAPAKPTKIERQGTPERVPLIEPLAISFDEELLAEDDETQREIDEFVRSSLVLRQEHHDAAKRASMSRENGLVLRLQQAQRQIFQLKEHIRATAQSDLPVDSHKQNSPPQQVDTDQSSTTDPQSTPVNSAAGISQASYQKLQKEIKTQDSLIAAFQKENERLMQQLKQVRQDVQYDLHEANEELRKQVKRLQDHAGQGLAAGDGDNHSIAKYRAAVEARLEAEAHAMALQEELAALRLTHQQKLNELTLELDRVKKAKVELECRYEGVDLVQVAQETQHARELQSELDLCRKEHAHTLAGLQKKLDWYVENQRLLDDQDDELRRLRREVSSKSPGVTPSKPERSAPTNGPSPGRPHRRSPADIRRIQELEHRLAELEEAMRRRHPDSLANLILASRRADEESKTRMLEHDYQEKLADLSRELEEAHEASETKLASFRQQQEKLMLQYRRKIKEQEKQLKQLSKAPLTHKTPAKEATKSAGTSAATDAELNRVRRFYTEKIKQLELKWEAKYRSQRKQQFMGLGRSDPSQQSRQDGLTYAESAAIITNLQKQIRDLEVEVKQERARADQLEGDSLMAFKTKSHSEEPTTEGTVTVDANLDPRAKELEERVSELELQLRDSESARSRLAQTLAAVQKIETIRATESAETPKTETPTESNTANTDVLSQQLNEEIAQLRRELDAAQDALAKERSVSLQKVSELEQTISDLVGKNEMLQAQLTDNRRDMQTLHKLTDAAERRNNSLEAQALRVPVLEEEIFSLRRELELPRTPSMVQYRSLELKVATLEQKHTLREAELKVVLDRALASSNLERLSREHAHRAAIAAKNAEIASFKRQLDEMLEELAQLQLSSRWPPELPDRGADSRRMRW